ncbi:hypothetical protein [Mycobacteroides abscessus]|uniref:hypothetical protein n=1 Tax=Mycobacteroides abscessus TaxID=36809 RepID=UPI000C26208F|nr:hypothetical protein [Mycobacteroides abscessus]
MAFTSREWDAAARITEYAPYADEAKRTRSLEDYTKDLIDEFFAEHHTYFHMSEELAVRVVRGLRLVGWNPPEDFSYGHP